MTMFNPHPNNDEELLEAEDACKFLTELWGLDEPYSLVAFRSLRFRYDIKPAVAAKRATLWTRSQLRQIPRPDKGKPRPSRRGPRKKVEEDGRTVIRMAQVGRQCRGHQTQPLSRDGLTIFVSNGA